MRLELIKRPQKSALYSAISPLLALVLTLLAGFLIFSLLGKPPVAALHAYFIEPLSEAWQLHELAIKAAPLIMIAVGLSVCYRSNNWNIGAEGQFIIGGITGSLVPILFPQFQTLFTLPVMLLLGFIGGAAMGAIPALLKTRFNTNEILTSLMLVYVAQLFLDWLARGRFRDPGGNNFPGSIRFPESARLGEIFPSHGSAHWGIVLAILSAIIVWFMMRFLMKGFEVKVLGGSPRAGRFGGFSSTKMVFFAFLLSGGLAGLAGIAEVAGAIGQLRETISPGYGFAAIIVAFLGRLNPLGAIAAGFVLALTYLGGEAAQMSLGVSEKVARVFQGLLLFFVLGCDTLIHYRIKFIFGEAGKPATAKG
ncbi:ABC transporter permease [Pseudohoeflea coraliihabitans]|uniref:ABC transporter permease n=1 Tax=Pseudohoeflea coraliihabitans TaxID=2860393 RepID=A0ABS6WR19_9HYPH|nr:ABC transporter permease [Pseudohoeflea sp. DP4N28-3]MBW3098404.1 ABC transporter permease [Pseudohoeflea sp. DP4N28-3]